MSRMQEYHQMGLVTFRCVENGYYDLNENKSFQYNSEEVSSYDNEMIVCPECDFKFKDQEEVLNKCFVDKIKIDNSRRQ